jgi:RNA polymerase sigma-70 factor (ECF subfamily)
MAVLLEGPGPGEERSRTESFACLYASTYQPLVGFCRRLLGGSGDPEELAQEAFLRAWVTWDRYAASRPFWALVSTIARNLCIDHHRHRQVAGAVLERRGLELSGSQDALPEEELEASEEYRWARQALEELRPRHRRVIHLRDVRGLSYEEIAEAEGMTVESVRGSLYRARRNLREAYARMAAGGLAAIVLGPLRRLRLRVGLWVHRASQAAASSPALAARAGDALAALVALAVLTSGAPALIQAGDGTSPAVPRAFAAGGGGVADTTTSVASTVVPPGAAPRAGSGQQAKADSPLEGTTGPYPVPGLGGGGETPEQATFTQFVASPHGDGRELYATGFSPEHCATAHCPVLFRSTDAGVSWTRLRAFAFVGGTVMLPPSYPADDRIFIAGPNALQVSNDHGASFTNLTPLGGFAAMSPAFSTGDRRILVGAVPGWIYHDDNNAVTPLDLAPVPASAALSFAFAPTYPADPRLLIGGAVARSGDAQSSVVSACNKNSCGPAVPLAGSDGVPTLLTTHAFATTGVAFAWQAGRLFRTSSGGATFSGLSLPVDAGVQALAEDAADNLYLALLSAQPDGTPVGGVFVSRDRGSTWARLGATTALFRGAYTVAALPDGRLFAAPDATTGGGLLCSADAGRTWARRCPHS